MSIFELIQKAKEARIAKDRANFQLQAALRKLQIAGVNLQIAIDLLEKAHAEMKGASEQAQEAYRKSTEASYMHLVCDGQLRDSCGRS